MQFNVDQIQSFIRWALSLSGPVGAYLISRGMTPEALDSVTTAIISIVGVIPPAIALIWGIKAHTDAAKLRSVESMPDVKSIVSIVNPDPNSAVAAAIDNPKMNKVVEG